MFDISIISAFFAGLLSFASPCILPIVPFYLSYLAGVGMNQINSDVEIDAATRRKAVLAATFFAAGVITIFIGLGLLYRQVSFDTGKLSKLSLLGSYVVGLAFAFGWTPCVGPVLAAILFMAAGAETVLNGALLLLTYGLGMTLPFVVAAFFIAPFMRWMVKFRRHLGMIEKVMGVFLILFGLLIATNSMNYIAQWMLELLPGFGILG
jgi:cytochrome c-type biogenesis protein